MPCMFRELLFTYIKIFSIYGPTLPQQTAPISDNVITFYEGEKCSPCMHQTLVLNKPCQYYPKPICLLKIKPETVVKKITEFLSNSKSVKNTNDFVIIS